MNTDCSSGANWIASRIRPTSITRTRCSNNFTMRTTPFFTPGLKGVPYQVAKAGANVVTVIPSNSFEKEFGVMEDTEQTGKILEELQAFMFLRAGVQVPPAKVGKTAIASFSSGNFILGRWLANPANRAGSFLSNIVTAVYFLDPVLAPGKIDVNTFVASALTWAGDR